MLTISIDDSQLEALQGKIESLSTNLQETLANAMPEAEEVLRAEMLVHPDPIPPPDETGTNVVWDTPKQRRAYHASNAWGRGDPTLNNAYIRQGLLDGALSNQPVEVKPGLVTGGVYDMSVEQWVKYVLGSYKQKSDIHVGRWRWDTEIRDAAKPSVVEVFNVAVKKALEGFK